MRPDTQTSLNSGHCVPKCFIKRPHSNRLKRLHFKIGFSCQNCLMRSAVSFFFLKKCHLGAYNSPSALNLKDSRRRSEKPEGSCVPILLPPFSLFIIKWELFPWSINLTPHMLMWISFWTPGRVRLDWRQGAVLQFCLPIKQLFTARPSVFILRSHSIRHSSITVLWAGHKSRGPYTGYSIVTHTLSLCLLPVQSGFFVVIGKLAKYPWDVKNMKCHIFFWCVVRQ